MKERTKILAVVGVLIAAVIALSPVSLAEEVITLRINTPMTIPDPSTPILEEYLREYERLNPHIRFENLGRDHSLDSLITTFAAGSMVDIVSHSTGTLYELYQLGMLDTVPEQLEARLRQELFPVIVEELSVDGRMIGVPNESMVIGLLYNARAMSEGGVMEVPETYDDLENVARRLSRYGPDGELLVPGIAIGQYNWQISHWVEAIFRAEGGQFLDSKGQLAIDSPELYKALEMLLRWSGHGGAQQIMTLEQERFQRGEVPFSVGWANTMARVEPLYSGDYLQDFGVALLPRGAHDHASTYYGHGFGVNRESPHAEEAWKFLEWLALDVVEETNSTRLGHIMSVYGTIPVNRADLESEYYARNIEHIVGFIDNLAYAHPYHNLKVRKGLHASDWHYLGTLYLNVLNGRTTLTQGVNDAVTKIHAQMETVLGQ